MSYSRKIHFLGAMSALKIINKVRKSKYYRTDLKKNEDLNSKDRNIQYNFPLSKFTRSDLLLSLECCLKTSLNTHVSLDL